VAGLDSEYGAGISEVALIGDASSSPKGRTNSYSFKDGGECDE
jgi:hypothetical protein